MGGDVFSVGSVLLYLVKDVDPNDLVELQQHVWAGGRLDLKSSMLRSLIEQCWKEDPEGRPSIGRVVELLAQVQFPVFHQEEFSLVGQLERHSPFGVIHLVESPHCSPRWAYVMNGRSSNEEEALARRFTNNLLMVFERCRQSESARFLELPLSPQATGLSWYRNILYILPGLLETADDPPVSLYGKPAFLFPFPCLKSLGKMLPFPSSCRTFALNLVEAVKLLHNAGLVHGMINLDTIFVNEVATPYAVLGGFEYVSEEGSAEPISAPPGYLPPDDSSSSLASDVFAVGSVLAQLMSGRFLSVEELSDMQEGAWRQPGSLRLAHSARLSSLIEQCWNRDPTLRPTIDFIADEFSAHRRWAKP
jgi:hypothetical protein